MAPPHVGVVLSLGRLVAEITPAVDDLLGRSAADAELKTLACNQTPAEAPASSAM